MANARQMQTSCTKHAPSPAATAVAIMAMMLITAHLISTPLALIVETRRPTANTGFQRASARATRRSCSPSVLSRVASARRSARRPMGASRITRSITRLYARSGQAKGAAIIIPTSCSPTAPSRAASASFDARIRINRGASLQARYLPLPVSPCLSCRRSSCRTGPLPSSLPACLPACVKCRCGQAAPRGLTTASAPPTPSL